MISLDENISSKVPMLQSNVATGTEELRGRWRLLKERERGGGGGGGGGGEEAIHYDK